MKKILVIAYYAYNDPIFQSTVIDYLKVIREKKNLNFILLTFENARFPITHDELKEIKEFHDSVGIIWYKSKWRSGRFKIIKKITDTLFSFHTYRSICKKHKIDFIYSEGIGSSILTFFFTRIIHKPFIAHSFEPHADPMLESGVWTKRSWEYKLAKKMEKKIATEAHILVTGTEAYKNIITSWQIQTPVVVIPSCVNIDNFEFQLSARIEIRNQLAIDDDTCVITYLGKFGGMYMEEEFFEFLKNCKDEEANTIKFFFFILSSDDPNKIVSHILNFNLDPSDFFIKRISRIEVPRYLSASDFGFVAVRPFPSKRYCSPIKDGEYWANGLPVIIPKGISDDYKLTAQHNLGIIIDNLKEESYKSAIYNIIKMFYAKIDRSRIREFARKNRSIKTYSQKFVNLFE